MVKIKDERRLLQGFIGISRNRSELDQHECIGTYEFSLVPGTLFASTGCFKAYYKASILYQEIESSANQATHVPLQVTTTTVEQLDVETNQPSAYRVVTIDGMTVVNSVTKTDQMKTCHDFADSFLVIIFNIAVKYYDVR